MAQLGARLNGIQKVRGSNPLTSTHQSLGVAVNARQGFPVALIVERSHTYRDAKKGRSHVRAKTLGLRKKWTVSELRKLPRAKRDRILRAAAALAEPEYRNNPVLRAFDAFGKNDLYGESSSAETR